MNPILIFFAALILPSLTFAQDKLEFAAADGKTYQPFIIGEKKANVLIFVSPYCPTSNTFTPEINQIAEDYAAHFGFYLVQSDPALSLTDAIQYIELFKVQAPVLLDQMQQLAKSVQAQVTPEAVVLGGNGEVLYQGRINDLYAGPTKKQRKATTRDLRDVLEAIVAGKPVANVKTEAIGCKISPAK